VSSDPSIACSLGADELPRRLAALGAVGRNSLLEVDSTGARAVLRFQPAAREELAAIVAAEAECCGFLSMELDVEPDGVLLTVAGPPEAEPVVRDLVGAFTKEVAC